MDEREAERDAYERGLLNICPVCRTLQPTSAANEWCDSCKKEPKWPKFVKKITFRKDHKLTPALKAKARTYANVYKRRGKLRQLPCEQCGNPDTEMHHTNYLQPLNVIWLCRPCHRAVDKAKNAKPRRIV